MNTQIPATTHVTLPYAIARMEGWLDETSRCRRNNNPGNIDYNSYDAHIFGAKSDGRFCIFSSPTVGMLALTFMLIVSYSGLKVSDAIKKYAPSTENNTEEYINNVCEWTGLTPDHILTVEDCTL